MEATVSNTLTDIFKAQAEVEDKKAQEQAVKKKLVTLLNLNVSSSLLVSLTKCMLT